MAAGFSYDYDGQAVERELCNQKTIYRLAGGFNLTDADVADGTSIPHLAPLSVDFATRVATVSKSVVIYEDATDSATAYKIKKGSLAYVGMFIGNGSAGAEVTVVDTSNDAYDTLTVDTTLGEAVSEDDILFESTLVNGLIVKNPANFLNYAKVAIGSYESVSAVGQAYEIKESELYLPISSADKATLGDRFMFV